jgi:sec-independent protein translocase protein TatB
MFDIGWGELLLIGIVALIAIGPKELPGALRTLGQWMAKLRRMASEFQGQFHEAMREAELADLKKQVDEMTTQAQSYANFDPVGEVRKEFETTQQQIESAISSPPPADTPSSTAVAAEPTTAPSVEAPRVEAPAVETPSSGAPSTEPPSGPTAPDVVRHDAEGKPA